MKKQLEQIKENVEKLSLDLIDPWEPYIDEESDSLLEDYTRKYDGFIANELEFYYRIS